MEHSTESKGRFVWCDMGQAALSGSKTKAPGFAGGYLLTFYDQSSAGVAVMRGLGHPAGQVGGDPVGSAKAWMAGTDPITIECVL